jgi:hypothetical protein
MYQRAGVWQRKCRLFGLTNTILREQNIHSIYSSYFIMQSSGVKCTMGPKQASFSKSVYKTQNTIMSNIPSKLATFFIKGLWLH